MIIWGSTHLKSKIGSGYFNCPKCESERPYTLKKYTEYFTLYFIPLIPMGSRGEFVECDSCKETYAKVILNYDPEAEMVANRTAVFRLLIAFMVQFQKTGLQHVEICRRVYSHLIEQEIPTEIVEKELAMAMQPDSSPEKYIRMEGPTFAGEAKLHLLAAARNITIAESVDEDYLRSVMIDFADMIGVNEEELNSVYEVVSELAVSQLEPPQEVESV